MSKLANKLACGDTKITAIVFGSFSVAQFVTEVLFFICFSVYFAAPFPTAIKVFYGIAAGFTPIFLVASILYIYGVSKDEFKWMNLWFITHGIVTITEIILTLVGLIFINDLNVIVQFYADAWNLAQIQEPNRIYVGDLDTCSPSISQTVLPTTGHGVTFAGLFAEQGATALIAFLVIALILKNLFNVLIFYVSYVHYVDLQTNVIRHGTYR